MDEKKAIEKQESQEKKEKEEEELNEKVEKAKDQGEDDPERSYPPTKT